MSYKKCKEIFVMKKGKKRNLLIVIASAIVAVFIAVGAAIHANEITTIKGLSGSDATLQIARDKWLILLAYPTMAGRGTT